MFDGRLRLWKTTPVKLELKPGVVPYHAKQYPIPRSCKETTRKEIERLCSIGVLEKCNDFKWGAPTFFYQKGTVRYALYWTSVSCTSNSNVNRFRFQKFKISC